MLNFTFIGRDSSKGLTKTQDERDGLIERLNRIETMISSRSTERHNEQENYPIQAYKGAANNSFGPDLSPVYRQRSAVSPMPPTRTE